MIVVYAISLLCLVALRSVAYRFFQSNVTGFERTSNLRKELTTKANRVQKDVAEHAAVTLELGRVREREKTLQSRATKWDNRYNVLRTKTEQLSSMRGRKTPYFAGMMDVIGISQVWELYGDQILTFVTFVLQSLITNIRDLQ